MRIIECQQGSEEWYTARLGKITASNFGKVMAKGQGKTRTAYMMQLAAERLTGLPQESFTNSAMEWGTENEPAARACYETINDVSVLRVGFCEHDDNIGVSPDGLVGDDGIVEFKCPNTTTHLGTILTDKFPTTYRAQVQGILWVTDRKWCDFVSFDPRMKSKKYHCIRVERDQEYIDNMKKETDLFVDQLIDMVAQVSPPF